MAKRLFDHADLDKLPDRVSRAHWNVQHAAYQYFFEVRTLLVVSGLDALVHVRTGAKGRVGTGRQFTGRIVQLASQLGISFTKADAEAVWGHRSDIAHGRDPWEFLKGAQAGFQLPTTLAKNDPLVQRYLKCEQILRSTVLACLTDHAFAAKFGSDQSVEKAFPI
jgi:hypothetical protein